jgi:hypothetical protein
LGQLVDNDLDTVGLGDRAKYGVVNGIACESETISKCLGLGYTVLASKGHVRDLPEKAESVLPEEQLAMSWVVKDEKRAVKWSSGRNIFFSHGP